MRHRITIRGILYGLLVIGFAASAATVSRITTFSDGSVLFASDLNSEFNNLVNNINALDDDNISDSANIDPAKIAATIAGDGITRNGSTGALTPNVDDVGIEISSSNLQLKADGVTNAKLADADALSVIGNATNASSNPTYIAAGSDAFVLRRSGTTLGFGTIATAGIANSAVTFAKLAQKASTGSGSDPGLGGVVFSASSGNYLSTSLTEQDVTNLSVTLTTNGGVVLIQLVSAGSAIGEGHVASDVFMDVILNVDSTNTLHAGIAFSSATPCGAVQFYDGTSAGTHTYKIRADINAAGYKQFNNCRLVAREL